MSSSPPRVPRTFYRLRNYLAGLPLVLAYFFRRWEWEDELAVWSTALLLCGAGIALRAWGISHCLYSHGAVDRLATGGPFRFVRNPLYLANTLIIAGATAASELFWLIPVSVLWCLAVYSLATRDEERRLARAFGDEYRRYREEVPAWMPRLDGPGAAGASSARLAPIAARQLSQLCYLLPFVVKELTS